MKLQITTIDGQSYSAVIVGSIAEKLGDEDIPGLPHRSYEVLSDPSDRLES